jgi:hypothetical protein
MATFSTLVYGGHRFPLSHDVEVILLPLFAFFCFVVDLLLMGVRLYGSGVSPIANHLFAPGEDSAGQPAEAARLEPGERAAWVTDRRHRVACQPAEGLLS